MVALAGDGAFLMTGLELLTAASQGIPLAVFLLRDGELAQIAQLQETAFHRKVATVLPDYHAGSLAEALGVEWLALQRDEEIEEVLERVARIVGEGRPVLVDSAIDYDRKTWFTRGIVKTNLARLPWRDRMRLVIRAMGRRLP